MNSNTNKTIIKAIIIFFILSAAPWITAASQTVGLVLSGGGAKGMAHIGVLRALEENNIPIDYISGSSIGAMVGGLYASGYTTDEIEMIFSSERFKQWSSGKIESAYYYSYMRESDAEMLSVWFKADSVQTKAYLPTNIISPHQMDFAFMRILAAPAAAANYNFDSLFVPFRCLASDVYEHKAVSFDSGYLPSAVRSSMTFPLYFKPIKIDGKVLFDGGIYDNFPKNIMKEDFNPDVIIGVKVVSNYEKPALDDIISQIENMVAGRSDYSLDKENGILIDLKLDNVKLMDFKSAPLTQQKGYDATIALMDSIKTKVDRRITQYERNKKRLTFRRKYPDLIFSEIQVTGLKKTRTEYIENLISMKKKLIGIEQLKDHYFKLIASEHIESLYPEAIIQDGNSHYLLRLNAGRAKKYKAGIGGNLSLTDLNQLYFGGKYLMLGQRAYKAYGNIYVGNFYNSAKMGARVYFPSKVPGFAEASLNFSRFNYTNGRTNSFFQDEQSPYIIKSQIFGDIFYGKPLSNNGYLKGGLTFSKNTYSYYQKIIFSSQDQADKTIMQFGKLYAGYHFNTLNYKNYADEGSKVDTKVSYYKGIEKYKPGNTSYTGESFSTGYDYFSFAGRFQDYYALNKRLTLGVDLSVYLSNTPFQSNYTSSITHAEAYVPFPYARTLFGDKYRAHNFAAGGVKFSLRLSDALSLRSEVYIYQPYRQILASATETNVIALYGDPLEYRYYMGKASLVFRTLIGPVYLSYNYFQNYSNDFYLSFGMGFLIFNKTAESQF
ncbi:MAG: patatin-like phospholipase family protein [Bacteroidota bacterium]|nr:patatin-like phospholipase family protein [Bacteroidota bacterium]